MLLIAAGAVHLWANNSVRYHRSFSHDYSQLATGFLHGHLYLPDQPLPALLALPDPYDPRANHGLRHHDAVLFEGRYYLYWGPVPALLGAAACFVMGVRDVDFGDQWLAAPFAFGTVVFATILIFQIRQRLFPTQRISSTWIPVLSLAIGAPMLMLVQPSAVYETAIIGGQCFLLAGLCAAWFGLVRHSPLLILIAGVCWTLSVGSRLSLAPAIATMAFVTAWHLRKMVRPLVTIIALFTPLIAGALLVAWYNHARFHSAFDFGWRYELAAEDQYDQPLSSFFSLRYVLPNSLGYLFTQPYWIKPFPYVRPWAADWVIRLLHLDRRYHVDLVVGLGWSQPFLLLAPFSLLRFKQAESRWLTMTLAAALLGAVPILTISTNTNRFLLDFVPCCTLLAAIGYWGLRERLEPHPPASREFQSAVRLIVASQCLFALALVKPL